MNLLGVDVLDATHGTLVSASRCVFECGVTSFSVAAVRLTVRSPFASWLPRHRNLAPPKTSQTPKYFPLRSHTCSRVLCISLSMYIYIYVYIYICI